MKIFWILFAAVAGLILWNSSPDQIQDLETGTIIEPDPGDSGRYTLSSGQTAVVGRTFLIFIEATEREGAEYARFKINGGILYSLEEGKTKTLEGLVVTPVDIHNERGVLNDSVVFSIRPA